MKNINFSIALLLTILPLSSSFATSEVGCFDVDVTDSNQKLKTIFATPRKQVLGWCYAYVAADILSAETNKKVSAAHVASVYNKNIEGNIFTKTEAMFVKFLEERKNPKKEYTYLENQELQNAYEGGFVKRALKFAVKAGQICSEKGLPSEKFTNLVKDLDVLKLAINAGPDKLTREEGIGATKFIIHAYGLRYEPENFYEVLKERNLNQLAEHILTNYCSDPIALDNYSISSTEKILSNKNSFMSEINDSIEHGKPVGLDYKAEFVSTLNGAHSSLLVGRRWKNGKCEYKIRNSWGQTCRPYKDGIDCNYKEGSYWVDQETLYDMSTRISRIKN